MLDSQSTFRDMALGALVFLAVALVGGVLFSITAYELYVHVVSQAEVIRFVKGAFYLVGCAISTVCFFLICLYWLIYRKSMPEEKQGFLMRIILAGMVIMFALPQIADFAVNKMLTDDGYALCQGMTYRGLVNSEYVYKIGTKNSMSRQ